MDPSKKTMRHFYCRDVLWETFEQMATSFDCSIDYLINEAMRVYARSQNFGVPATTGAATGNVGAVPRPTDGAPVPPPQPQGGPPPPPAPPMQRYSQPPPPPRVEAPPLPSWAPPQAAAPPGQYQGGAAPARRLTTPQPRPSPEPAPAPSGPRLFLIFNNQRIPIDKDQFIIGRGSKTSDLAIKDGNISRKHAAVIRRNGTFYIKDLGSTNGIDYKGMRIDNKRIDEGDVFHLCDYELRFTYRAD
jgi:pSer/pThr/pTyr-binding forkhead associated (FHA) protein